MSSQSFDVLKRPIISEKATLVKELANTVVFEVDKKATKVDIKRAVEKAFNVEVKGVRTAVVRGKNARMGKSLGRKNNWKKAYVTLSAGQNIEFFEGV